MISKSIVTLQMSILVGFLLCASSLAQQKNITPTDAEIRSEVPELTKFHEVIYKIWHTAWPEKDVTMLKGLSPEVEQLGGELCNAELPGILREKRGSWAIYIDTLKLILKNYGLAANEGDSKGLLNAAEQLHRQYERLVRLLRPALKELEDFHSILYPLYHYIKPHKDLEKTTVSVARLVEKMQALQQATLPAKWKDKVDAFEKARKELATSVSLLNAKLSGRDWEVIERGIDAVHTRYEVASRLFD